MSRCAKRYMRPLLCVLCLLFGHGTDAKAEEAADFGGQTVIIYSSTSPGGGYDAYARLLARHIGKYLPGNPRILVKNMTGAAGFTLANYLYRVAAKDGTEIGILENNLPFAPLITGKPAEFDAVKFGWLGSLDRYVPIMFAWHSSSFRTIDDLRSKQMLVGGTGAGGNMSTYAHVLQAVLGTKIKVINGYPGSTEITLAIERGELDGMTGWCWTCMKFQKPDWISEGKIRVIMQLSAEGDPELNALGIPKVLEFTKDDEQKQILQVIFASASVARTFTAPPGVPPQRLELLRAAVAKAAADPELIVEGARSGNKVDFVAAADVISTIKRAYATNPDVLAKLNAAASGK